MRPDPKCVIDRTRACGACIAPSPRECPYAYLLDPDDLASVVAAGRPGKAPAGTSADDRREQVRPR